MVQLAIEGNPSFRLSRAELDYPPPYYAVDTVGRIRKELGVNAQLLYLLGSDAAGQLSSWRDLDTLRALVQFVVVPRPGYPVQELPPGTKTIELEAPDISSSEIRQRLREGKTIQDLVPETVARYIKEHLLYR